ncbi:hypothetical protein COX85_02320 [Candidatus Micrarchaeota archaeon CG_4_10_14_0_2_um_filter_55_9]|nr:MAG: hypothetical protein COT57_02545 [Candidatus Micrarchaeota archaeon CG09_land_8_20_14_0_10_55_25]PIZ91725.1 MAG: hypothetical protein COX85_02320 [Candidatus Micrarchaeota archaeon CG_4_10_14_0_2_um_filter_55_9]PJD01266.1 MAG: hypothetical protein COU38_01955 [Candidatus Micrarchaeota archaeon CG10_big_fil_rev_8_21_14_0_10_54_18]
MKFKIYSWKHLAVKLASIVLLLFAFLAWPYSQPVSIIAVFASVFFYLLIRPIDVTFLRPVEELHSKAGIPRSGYGPVLIYSGKEISSSAKHKRFSLLDRSLFWFNIIQSEAGSCRLVDVEELEKSVLRGAPLAVVSRSACKALNEESAELLRNFGGALIIDFPDSKQSASLSGLTGNAKKVVFKKVGGVGLNVVGLSGGFRGLVLLGSRRRPQAFYSNLRGAPTIVTLFDFANVIASIEQGVPEEDYSLPKRFGLKRPFSSKFVISQELRAARKPVANILKKTLFGALQVPRFWPYPFEFDGAAIMTHDEDYYGDASSFVTDFEKSEGVHSTFFPIPDSPFISGKVLNEMNSLIGLHWNRYAIPVPIVSRFVHPLRMKQSLHDQVGALEDMLGRKLGFRCCRIHGLIWGSDFDSTFSVLQGNGFSADSSYGSSTQGNGYQFGTGVPFKPLDKNGLPYSVLEFPYALAEDYAGFGERELKKLFRESAAKYHEVLTALYHPRNIASGRSKRLWKLFFREAEANNHWLTDLREFCEWREKIFSCRLLFCGGKVSWANAPRNAALLVPRIAKLSAGFKKRKVTVLGKEYYLVRCCASKGSLGLLS